MKRIKIIDYYSVKTFHEVVNFSLVRICSDLFKKVTYISGQSAHNNMKRLVSQSEKVLSNLTYQVVLTYNADTPWGARIRDVLGIFITICQYVITPYNTVLLFNYTNKLSLPIILGLNLLLKKQIIFLFHGELEFLVSKVSYLKTSGWYKKCMQLSFRNLFTGSPAYVLVLGDSIRENLLKIYPNLSSHVLSICHPYFVEKKDINNSFNQDNDGVVRIGTVGTMKESKGLKEYVYLASSLIDLLKDRKLELYSIGRVYAGSTQLTDNIIWMGWKEGLSRDEFELQIKKLDYLLFLYPIDSYKFTASGAILDAVRLHKPIIALHNDYFDFLMGDNLIGYMGYSVKDLEEKIRKIVNHELMNDFTNGFYALEKKVEINSNVELFKKELERICWL